MTSQGQTMPGGSLCVPGIPVPKTPVVHTTPTAIERAAGARPQPQEDK